MFIAEAHQNSARTGRVSEDSTPNTAGEVIDVAFCILWSCITQLQERCVEGVKGNTISKGRPKTTVTACYEQDTQIFNSIPLLSLLFFSARGRPSQPKSTSSISRIHWTQTIRCLETPSPRGVKSLLSDISHPKETAKFVQGVSGIILSGVKS